MAVIFFSGGRPQKSPDQVTGLQAWWKADANVYSDAGVTLATNGQEAHQWNDQSVNARHLINAGAGTRPVYTTNYQNSLPALVFDGADDQYAPITFQTALVGASDKTVYAVVKAIGATYCPFLIHETTGSISVVQLSGDTGNVRATNYDGSTDTASKAGTITNMHIATLVHDGATLYAGYNDTRLSSMGSTASGASSGLASTDTFYTRTAGAFQNMALCEMFSFNTVVSEDDRMALDQYLSNKWGITLPY
jgi:hypothetical protein